MSGTFGTTEGGWADPFPLHRVIEAGTGLSSIELGRAGLMFDGAVGTVLIGTIPSLARTGTAEVFIGETRLRTRPDPALNFRHWVCPVCDRSCRHLYYIGG